MATLRATNISVRLAGTPVLTDMSLAARAGEVTIIVGPNGSGKTTLLRAMTQDIRYDGLVSLDGNDIAQLPAPQLAARRGVLPQASRIAFPFTVLEIVRLGLTSATEPAPPTRPSDALRRVGLSGFEGRFYQELSGGEQQRTQLARVLCQVWEPVGPQGPNWLFLDEPVSSLDIGHQLEVMDLIADYTAGGGGVIAVMHDLNLTAMYANQVILLASGHCLAAGPPREVLTDKKLSAAYGCDLRVNCVPDMPSTYLLPHMARRTGE